MGEEDSVRGGESNSDVNQELFNGILRGEVFITGKDDYKRDNVVKGLMLSDRLRREFTGGLILVDSKGKYQSILGGVPVGLTYLRRELDYINQINAVYDIYQSRLWSEVIEEDEETGVKSRDTWSNILMLIEGTDMFWSKVRNILGYGEDFQKYKEKEQELLKEGYKYNIYTVRVVREYEKYKMEKEFTEITDK